VLLLIDSRHGFKDVDRELMKMMDEAAVAYRVVLTKTDKAENLEEMVETVKAELKTRTAAHPEPLLTSAEEKRGIAELQEMIAGII
jgi:GTP-binding protein